MCSSHRSLRVHVGGTTRLTRAAYTSLSKKWLPLVALALGLAACDDPARAQEPPRIVLRATNPAGVPLHPEERSRAMTGRLPDRIEVEVLRWSGDHRWLEVRDRGGRQGWITRRYVADEDVDPAPLDPWSSRQACLARLGDAPARDPDHPRIASWNLRWFPDGSSHGPSDHPTDVGWVACLIATMRVDAVALQEILLHERGEAAVERLRARLDALTGGHWEARFDRCPRDGRQHVGWLVDTSRVALVRDRQLDEVGPLGGCRGNLRPGLMVYLRFRSGLDLSAVVVHLDSGETARDHRNRVRSEEALLAAARSSASSDPDVLVVGDFNTMGCSDCAGGLDAESEIAALDARLAPALRRAAPSVACTEIYPSSRRAAGSRAGDALAARRPRRSPRALRAPSLPPPARRAPADARRAERSLPHHPRARRVGGRAPRLRLTPESAVLSSRPSWLDGYAIIGGGPAGSALALGLVERGVEPADLVVFDKARFPRPKLCGGALTVRGTEALSALIGEPEGGVRTGGLTFHSELGSLDIVERGGQWIYDRAVLDDALLAAVKTRGVEVREATAVSALEPAVEGWTVKSGRDVSERFDWVAGADGACGISRRASGLQGGITGRLVEAVYEAVDAEPDPSRLYFDFDPVLDGIPGYAWIFPYPSPSGARRWKIGVMDGRGRVPGSALRDWTERFATRSGFRRVEDKIAGWPERYLDGKTRGARPGLVLVGEAYGIDPLLGEGIAPALQHAGYAAGRLKDALDRGLDCVSGYERGFTRTAEGKNLRFQRYLADMLYGPKGPRWLRVLFALPRFRALAESGRKRTADWRATCPR